MKTINKLTAQLKRLCIEETAILQKREVAVERQQESATQEVSFAVNNRMK